MAAEIPPPNRGGESVCTRFNEAAANGRGNHAQKEKNDVGFHGASMRPRRMAAEITVFSATLVLLARASMRPRRMAAEIMLRTLLDMGACPLQ